ncbi:MAG TPA: MarR family transcriptional regulator [Bryobacteraceae bacterium]|nr:MarR family transcriptional regulator [Bryobacteraceae bacterium]
MSLSTENCARLRDEINRLIRQSIAGSILFNQSVADRFQLRLTDMQCLNILDLLGPVTPGKLAECTGLTTGGVTVMLDRLEKAKFVKREPNPSDRRSLLIRVNPRKLRPVNALYAGINRQLDAVFAETSESELQAVARFLTRMNAIRMRPHQP